MHFLRYLMQQADDARVQWRFRWVELRACQRSTNHLPDDLRQARQRNLDELRRYWQQGIFPRNRQHMRQTPVFIDPDGRRCAVAHLVMESGHATVAHTISQQANFALVPAIQFPELDSWAQSNGFTRAELARIQPVYGPDVTDPVAWAALVSTAYNYLRILGFMLLVGVGSAWLQIIAISRRTPQPPWPKWIVVSGLVAALFSLTVIFDLLSAMRPMMNTNRPSYMAGVETMDYSTVWFASGSGFLIGLVLAGIGLLLLGLRFWRTRQHREKAKRAIIQPE